MLRLRCDETMARLRRETRRARILWRHARARAAGADIVSRLITGADRIEAGFRAACRLGRRLAPRGGLGLPGALAWRIAAALCGVSLTAALVTGLSAKSEDPPQLAGLASAAAAATSSSPAAGHKARPVAEADWVSVTRPIAIFNLEAPELGRDAPVVGARRSPDGRSREDLMSFGAFAGADAHLALRLRTGEDIAAGAGSFTVAFVHTAALGGLAVARAGTPAALETRFGALETADVVLGDGTRSRGCLAFRTMESEALFAMSGWWCAGSRPSDRRQLACLIDRLDLANAGAEPALRSAFARSELKRQPACASPRLSATGRKVSWLDADGRMPALRAKTATPEPPAQPRPGRAKATRRQR
ncbi:hypothetical protein [Bosea sp. (in: a-proteobacteria)]|uniref:hypothetical protein n=1 Tax=Bosea sp. (in: a-proteobacteria) TaxID=1871050 RepID=UPI0026381C90|nr:hypothetical protein [Bosea sp. (in: a-proteobacteria)]MCO5090805.1 hypothetical protein [Bosea sp. (in: a-proteobacteria)]